MTRNRGFTLTEILVVIILIALVVSLAVAALPYMTSANSVEAAQNTVSAYLGRTRMDAMRLYGRAGVFFYESEGRTRLVEVTYDASTPAEWDLKLIEDRDAMTLQGGVGVGLINDHTIAGATTRYTQSGVIMFNITGQLHVTRYEVPPNMVTGFPGTPEMQTQFGFCLYEREVYENAEQAGSNMDNWIDQFAVPLIVNRYNGTLIRGE